MKQQLNKSKLRPEQVEVFDWGIFELHVDIDFYVTEEAQTGEIYVVKHTPYRVSLTLPRAARILEACGSIEIERIDYGNLTVLTVIDDKGGVRESALYDLIDDILYDNLSAFICELWNCPAERQGYVKELEAA